MEATKQTKPTNPNKGLVKQPSKASVNKALLENLTMENELLRNQIKACEEEIKRLSKIASKYAIAEQTLTTIDATLTLYVAAVKNN